jgi:hypothetical protein
VIQGHGAGIMEESNLLLSSQPLDKRNLNEKAIAMKFDLSSTKQA